MFELMIQSIKEETVKFCYNVTLQTETTRKQIVKATDSKKDDYNESGFGASNANVPQGAVIPEREKKQETIKRTDAKVGRNDPCPCGSGKKYKNCCGK